MMGRTVRIVTIVLGVVASNAAGPEYAWWLTARFAPKASVVLGIPIQQIDASWSAATLLRDAAMPAAASKRGESVAEHGGMLQVKADLDADGQVEQAVVGVYATRRGEQGRFLLVLSEVGPGKWSKRALFQEPGDPGFSVLFRADKQLAWAFCMECDSRCLVKPFKGQWQLECESCCEV